MNYKHLAQQLETIQSFVRPDEMRLLYDLAQPGYRCADLGVGAGKSTILMAARAHVLAVSLWHWPGEGDCAVFQETLERFPDCAERITAICADTAQTGQQLAPFGPQFDVVFIDAGHQEHDVQADVLAWAPLLSSRGVLVFHDYSPRWVGVRTVVDRMCENGWECVQSVQSIRVLKKGHCPMTRGRRVPSAQPTPYSPEHIERVQAFMRDVDATAREHADTRGAVAVTIGEPVHIAYVPAERLTEMVPPELVRKVRAYDMAKEYVVIAVDRSKQPPLEYRIVKRGE